MFDKQIQKAVDAVGDEKKAIDTIGYTITIIVIICVIILYFVWRPKPVPKINNNVPIPGSQAIPQ